jgi:glycosyltransferase involved in cell wall biosynthesis
VGTKIDGLSEVIEDGVSGYLVPAGNSQALGDAVIELLNDSQKAKAIGRNGCKRVENLFSLVHFRASMIGLYNIFENG